jgi:hypothetical protein
MPRSACPNNKDLQLTSRIGSIREPNAQPGLKTHDYLLIIRSADSHWASRIWERLLEENGFCADARNGFSLEQSGGVRSGKIGSSKNYSLYYLALTHSNRLQIYLLPVFCLVRDDSGIGFRRSQTILRGRNRDSPSRI